MLERIHYIYIDWWPANLWSGITIGVFTAVLRFTPLLLSFKVSMHSYRSLDWDMCMDWWSANQWLGITVGVFTAVLRFTPPPPII